MRNLKEMLAFFAIYVVLMLLLGVLFYIKNSLGQVILNILGCFLLCIISDKISEWLLK